MTFQQAIESGFNKYTKFEGRDGRPAFWYWALFAFLVGVAASIVDAILGTGTTTGGLIQGLTSLALVVPGLAVGCRRLHDIGKSGWWQLVAFVPVLGWIYLIYLFAQPGDPNANEFGPPPAQIPAVV